MQWAAVRMSLTQKLWTRRELCHANSPSEERPTSRPRVFMFPVFARIIRKISSSATLETSEPSQKSVLNGF
jgi:hypothetical protein